MVTLNDVAKKANVSVSTVSNVLNNKQNVGETTRQRVLGVCKELGYTAHNIDRIFRSDEHMIILFCFSAFDRSFYMDYVKGIQACCKERGYDFAITTFESYEKFAASGLSVGSIVLDERITDDVVVKLSGKNHPIVLLDRVIDKPHIMSTVIDNYTPMTLMTRKLVDSGYVRFAFIGGPVKTLDTTERFDAFQNALVSKGIHFDKALFYEGDYREESGYKIAKKIVLKGAMPEVLVCANDSMAIGAIKSFREEGINVPSDIVVTGFDDGELAEAYGLKTVTVPREEMGYAACDKLIKAIEEGVYENMNRIESILNWR